MNILGIIIGLGLLAFCVYEVYGIVKAIKERKKNKQVEGDKSSQ